MRFSKAPRYVACATALCLTLIGHQAAAAAPVQVTTCGQVVARVGVLAADLDCSGSTGPAVVLQRGARLNLAGFTLTADDTGVQCGPNCKLVGPGVIRRTSYDPTRETIGIFASGAARVLDGVALENWRVGMYALGNLRVNGATVSTCTVGAVGAPIWVVGSTFTGNEMGVHGGEGTKDGVHYTFFSCQVRSSTFGANAIDIGCYRRPTVRDADCTTSDHLTVPPTPFSGGDEWQVCT